MCSIPASWNCLAFFCLFLSTVETSSLIIMIGKEKLQGEVNPRFVSMAIDAHVLAENWKNLDFNSKCVQNLARGLSPGYLRLGGTAADLVIFRRKGKEDLLPLSTMTWSNDGSETNPASLDSTCYCTTSITEKKVCEDLAKIYQHNITMTGWDWVRINRFAQKANLHFLFDFNYLLREKGRWSKRNAQRLLKFSSRMDFDGISWELGNEPNGVKFHINKTLPPFQLGQSNYQLRKLLNRFPLYQGSTLVGPDLNQMDGCEAGQKPPCKTLQYLGRVLKGSRGALDAVTWHFYYLDGTTAGKADFLDVSVFDYLQTQISAVSDYMRNIGQQARPLWLGETAQAYAGGVHGITNRYLGGFLWLEILGRSAANNYQVVIRQTFYHGCYALIGEDLRPNPDYWISLLHKRLTGTKVLSIAGSGGSNRQSIDKSLRIFGHCSHKRLGHPGSVTLFAMNLSNSTKTFQLDPTLTESRVDHYVLSAKDGDLTTRSILLNGKELELLQDTYLPKLVPWRTAQRSSLFIRSYEMVFWVFPDAKLSICA